MRQTVRDRADHRPKALRVDIVRWAAAMAKTAASLHDEETSRRADRQAAGLNLRVVKDLYAQAGCAEQGPTAGALLAEAQAVLFGVIRNDSHRSVLRSLLLLASLAPKQRVGRRPRPGRSDTPFGFVALHKLMTRVIPAHAPTAALR